MVELLKTRLTDFFEACPAAWEKVLEIKGTTSITSAKNLKARMVSAGPLPGAPAQPLDERIPLD